MVCKLAMTGVENRCLVYKDHSETFRDMWDKGDVAMGGGRCVYDGMYSICFLSIDLWTIFT